VFAAPASGPNDNSTKVYSCDDGDPDLARFTIEHDRAYILPVLRLARQMNPNLFLFSYSCFPRRGARPAG
jgi:glucosylceramidase